MVMQRRTTIRFPDGLDKRLEKIAKEKVLSKSDIIRLAILDYVAKYEKEGRL